MWLAPRYVPESQDETALAPLDWRGGGLAILAFGLLTVGLTRLAATSDNILTSIALLIAGAISLSLFLRTEAHTANPLTPLSLFTDRAFTGANITTLFLLYGALSGVLFLLPFELIERRGLSATGGGLTLLPIGIIIGTLSRFASAWADRIGPRSPLIVGSVLVAMAATFLALRFSSFWFGVLSPVLIMSLGMAIVLAPLTTAVMNAASDAQSGFVP